MTRDKRRLAAIVSFDVVGYSLLMGRDDSATLSAFKAHLAELIDPKIAEYGGRIVKTTGDGLLVEFASVVDAVRCCVEVQSAMVERNRAVAPDRRIVFRAGINVGDIIIDGDDIFGDGVNVAARLQTLADAGGICVSRVVRDQVFDKVDFGFVDLGAHEVKNITRPIEVFRVDVTPGARPRARTALAGTRKAKSAKWVAAAAAVAVCVAAVLLALRPSQHAAVPLAPGPDAHSVAVLAFTNLSGDKDNEYFSDGISEELLSVLQRVGGLHVAARLSAFSFKGKNATAQEIGEKLGVAYLVEGSVRKAGDSVRITARLSRAANGEQVWSDTYTRDAKDVFAVQSELAQTIVEQMRGQIGDVNASARREIKAQVQEASKGGTRNAEAYDLYLQGKAFLYEFSPDSAIRAAGFLKRAVALDPDFALAWAALSWSGAVRGGYAMNARELDEAFQLARQAADRAIALQPSLPAAHMARMRVQMWYDFDWKGASESLRRAQAIAPSDADVLASEAELAYALGQRETALKAASRAVVADPVNTWTRVVLAMAFDSVGRFREAEAQFRRVIELSPGAPWGHAGVGWVFVREERFDDAVREASLESEEFTRLTVQAHAYWGQDKRRESDAALDRLIATGADTSAYQVAEIYAYRRDHDHAFEWLERAYRQHDPGLAWAKCDASLARIHDDRRWAAFLTKLGLSEPGAPR